MKTQNGTKCSTLYMDLATRQLVFLIGCMGMRFGLSYLASGRFIMKYTSVLTFLLLAIGWGFLIIYFGGLRDHGFEAGGQIWWDSLRPVHGLFYIIAALLLWYDMNSYSSLVLIVDTIIGLLAFLYHHKLW